MVQVAIKGLLAADFDGQEAPPMLFKGERYPAYRRDHVVEIRNARNLQSGATSESDLFSKQSFALLKHETAVRDWDVDAAGIYLPEIASIIRQRLLPGRKVEVLQSQRVIQRGGGDRFYGEGVHSDGTRTPEGHAFNLGAFGTGEAERKWLCNYRRNEVAGFMLINFWRPIYMRDPVRDFPLALCDSRSLSSDDVFPVTIPHLVVGPRASRHLALRFNANQQWYYYPEMTTSEVLVFKQCEFWKDDPGADPKNIFHTAFRDPTCPPGAEPRRSCEHRVGVMIFRD